MGQVTSLIGRLKAGSRSAFDALFAAYYPRQVRQAHRHLGERYAGLADPEDVAQSVLRTLWHAVVNNASFRDRLTDSRSLHAALALLSRQKAGKAIRYDTRACRNIHKTCREADVAPWDKEARALDLLAASGSPSSRAMETADTFAVLLAQLDDRQKIVLLHRLDGWTNAEIACHLGRCERTVERCLAEVRDLWASHPDLAALLGNPESLFSTLPE